jgi:hypothetical protein
LKKSSKKRLGVWRVLVGPAGDTAKAGGWTTLAPAPPGAKVFWFLFSKKNVFRLPALRPAWAKFLTLRAFLPKGQRKLRYCASGRLCARVIPL